MALHGIACITMGVPDVDATCAYYADFGLTPWSAASSALPTQASS